MIFALGGLSGGNGSRFGLGGFLAGFLAFKSGLLPLLSLLFLGEAFLFLFFLLFLSLLLFLSFFLLSGFLTFLLLGTAFGKTLLLL